ncbi:holo-ACP synthase [Pseudohalioglobus lutimaris]|uniref:Holo-[acyl-carrier-protein] synthase n=1 Tax=Pseudohalioglobus lutimaris TaxID=1737061 RepID=A0A2N5X0L5_9GAMM|nr:holo-ACP synthase [Pseudohalioglobus lutimaris]PLW68018.1 holo-ACP synthase [Pseudohalioglobus lutimaris]
MIAVGTDILRFDRIDAVVERQGLRFVERILCPEECEEYADSARPANLLAKRFAAKEAVAKALGTGIGRGVSWQDIRIAHNAHGAPVVELTGGALRVARELGGTRVALSLADEVDCVVAFAVLA